MRFLAIRNASEMTNADMDPIEELTELTGLQFSNCGRLTHLNPFIGLKKLVVLKIGPLSPFPKKDIEAFKAAHPDTIVDYNP